MSMRTLCCRCVALLNSLDCAMGVNFHVSVTILRVDALEFDCKLGQAFIHAHRSTRHRLLWCLFRLMVHGLPLMVVGLLMPVAVQLCMQLMPSLQKFCSQTQPTSLTCKMNIIGTALTFYCSVTPFKAVLLDRDNTS